MVAPAVVAGIAGRTALKQGIKIAAKQGVKQGAKAAATGAAKRSAKGVITEAMPTLSRFASNPAMAKRFLKTKAGKKAMFNFGTDLLSTDDAQHSIEKIIKQMKGKMKGRQDFDSATQEFNASQINTDEIKNKLHSGELTAEDMTRLTADMKQSIAEMQDILQKLESMQTVQLQQENAQATR